LGIRFLDDQLFFPEREKNEHKSCNCKPFEPYKLKHQTYFWKTQKRPKRLKKPTTSKCSGYTPFQDIFGMARYLFGGYFEYELKNKEFFNFKVLGVVSIHMQFY
jgi:hypothetical protein